jgi:hypothetical protein
MEHQYTAMNISLAIRIQLYRLHEPARAYLYSFQDATRHHRIQQLPHFALAYFGRLRKGPRAHKLTEPQEIELGLSQLSTRAMEATERRS